MIRTNKGFTLIELMVVIVIIGILAALAIPKFTDASVKAKLAEIPTVMAAWDHAILAKVSESGTLPLAAADLIYEGTTSKWFAYDPTYVAASSTMKAEVAAGQKVGPYVAGDGDATSVYVLATGVTTHNNAGFALKYMPNFVP